ncbi:MAG: helix-turn-helix transcriptional regulator [Eubacteriaceae bacterium]|nr:helix-turn-helix transcriptional regulator [Eubacteriaceae bacterium]
MAKLDLPQRENIYETDCPILYAMNLIGQKWKLPILWYMADAENQTLRYKELERKVVGITATMLTKCLRELEKDGFINRKQYATIPPTVEYSLAKRGRTLIPALESIYQWAEKQMKDESDAGDGLTMNDE